MKNKGFTLFEMVIFILVISIIAAGLSKPLLQSLRHTHNPDQQNIALELAQARMELILSQKQLHGFSSYSDPCDAPPMPAICTAPNGYTVTSTINNSWNANTDYNQISVSVTGTAKADLTTLVARHG